MVTGTQKSYCITGEVPRNSAGATPTMVSECRLTRTVFPTIAGIGVEIAAPQAGADHRHGIRAQAVAGLFAREDAAQRRA